MLWRPKAQNTNEYNYKMHISKQQLCQTRVVMVPPCHAIPHIVGDGKGSWPQLFLATIFAVFFVFT